MARHTMHLIRSQDSTGRYVAYCGHTQHSNYNLTQSPERPDLCPKCSSKYYAEQIKSLPYRLGDRLDLSLDTRRYTYKSIYGIFDDTGAAIGFLTIKSGWGRAWYVHSWRDGGASVEDIAQDVVREPIMSFDPVKYRRKPEDGDREYGGTFSSKEQALFAVPLMVEQGKLPSRDTVFAKSQERVATLKTNMAAQDARRKLVADQRAEDMRLIQEEFGDMLASGKLTNRQHMALNKAAELLGVKFTKETVDG